MSSDRFNRLQQLFQQAVAIPTPQREAWLTDQCADNQDLLYDVKRLLSQDEREDDPLESGVIGLVNGLAPALEHQYQSARLLQSSSSIDEFVVALVESGLFEAAEIETLQQRHASVDTSIFVERLIGDQKLTQYQAKALLSGNEQPLVLGNYVVLHEIGAGGMGTVYLADHRRMKRKVALKVLPSALTEDAAAVERFQREVEAAARLSHPNIVRAYDADRSGKVHFFVMEFVDGPDLDGLVKENGPLGFQEAVDCVRQIATGLQYAHGQGIIHRDIKPANILLDQSGTVQILDMGLARYQACRQETELTSSGMAMGTADFMAPEQGLNAKSADQRSDIYSLGCTLYYLLTGRKVFGGRSLVEKVMAHQNDPIPSLTAACPHSTPELDAVFEKMVAKAPNDRYQSATSLLSDLAALGGRQAAGESGDSLSPLKKLASHLKLKTASPITSPRQQPDSETWPSSLGDDTFAHPAGRPAKVDQRLPVRVGGYRKGNVIAVATGLAIVLAIAFTVWWTHPGSGGGSGTQPANTKRGSGRILPGARFTHFSNDDGFDNPAPLFANGPVKENDALRIEIQFEEPMYCFLFAINPDGVIQLCHPEDKPELVQKKASKHLKYPSKQNQGFPFTDGIGQQAFVLVESKEPLPSFSEWSAAAGKMADQIRRTKGRWLWKKGALSAWASNTARGAPRQLRGSDGFNGVMRDLASAHPKCTVSGLTFPVESR